MPRAQSIAMYDKRIKRAERQGKERFVVVAIAILGQLAFYAVLSGFLWKQSALVYMAIQLVCGIVIMSLTNKPRPASEKIAWILIVLVLPIFGLLLYLAWGNVSIDKKERGHMEAAFDRGAQELCQDEAAMDALRAQHGGWKRQFEYLSRKGFPVYRGTSAVYYPVGEQYFEALIADLQRAERFIFLEYFIVGEGQLWDRVHEVLKEKAAAGVEVRLFYDDAGCIYTLPRGFKKKLEAEGIRVEVFNPIYRYLSNLYLSFRNHQKIVVVDGTCAYTGGVNLADEYVNLYPKHGHWKDTGVRFSGETVWGLTVQFLQMWDFSTHTVTADYSRYRAACQTEGDGGFYQPFMDGPGNNPENPAEDTFKQMFSLAQQRIDLATPYLIVEDEVIDSLCRAAKSGVSVNLYLPGIPDKSYVYASTQASYGRLLEAGVRIYEYTPGFLHAKMAVADGEYAFIGTINMDNRSLYLHYENGVSVYGGPLIGSISDDFVFLREKSREVTLAQWKKRPAYKRALQTVLRLLQPMM